MTSDPRSIGLIGRAMDIDREQGIVMVKNSRKEAFVCQLGKEDHEVHVDGGEGGKVFSNKSVCPKCNEVKWKDERDNSRYCPVHD